MQGMRLAALVARPGSSPAPACIRHTAVAGNAASCPLFQASAHLEEPVAHNVARPHLKRGGVLALVAALQQLRQQGGGTGHRREARVT